MKRQSGATRLFAISVIVLMLLNVVPLGQALSSNSERSSLICGNVYDESTSYPLEGVHVQLHWQTEDGYGYDDTYTNDEGFYNFTKSNVEFDLHFYFKDYFTFYSNYYEIDDDTIFWYNTTLTHYPPVSVTILGYITDNATGAPVNDAHVIVNWYDPYGGHSWSNSTSANESGFYQLGCFEGLTHLSISRSNYFSYDSDEFITDNGSVIWLNVSLIPYPPVNCFITGYITDNQTGDAIPNTYLSITSVTEEGYWYNNTHTDENGFFYIGALAGYIQLYLSNADYKYKYVNFYINETESLWKNLTMQFQPKILGTIKGYVTDSETNAVIHHAYVHTDWKDAVGHFLSNATFTDQTGYYSLKIPEGAVEVLVTANGYTSYLSPWMAIEKETELWLNATLTPEIAIKIVKPVPGIYVYDQPIPVITQFLTRFAPCFKPIIIGPIYITVNLTAPILGCNRMEFYIDDTHAATVTEPPYEYLWNRKTLGLHTIRITAYDSAGPCTTQSITVRTIL